jgi:predicted DNA-binding transcriptional regulator YafY
MRAARLLHMLMILQNRGQQSCAALARALEVSRRTILRDLDALTEAGLPVIVHRGAQGGVELGFDYRTRLTGLDSDEADAMAVVLAVVPPEAHHLNLADACRRAQAKVREAFPEQTRARIAVMEQLFPNAALPPSPDPRREALARAVRQAQVVRLQATGPAPVVVHPAALVLCGAGEWVLRDSLSGRNWPESSWGDINISARRFPRPDVSLHPATERGTSRP